MLLTLFTFPTDFYASISTYISDIFSSSLPLILILIGLFVAFFIIERLVDLAR